MIPGLTITFIGGIVELLLAVVCLTAFILYAQHNGQYINTLQLRPNTTTFFMAPGVNTPIRIVDITDTIRIYESVSIVTEYSLNYKDPVLYTMKRSIGTQEKISIGLGYIQGVVDIQLNVDDPANCLGNQQVPFTIKRIQQEFSYAPYVTTETGYLNVRVPRTFEYAGSINELFACYLELGRTVWKEDGRTYEDPNPQDCTYDLAVIVRSISYDMRSVPHWALLTPANFESSQVYTPPVAIRAEGAINSQTTVVVQTSPTKWQRMGELQLLLLSILFGTICILTISGSVVERLRVAKLQKQHSSYPLLDDSL
ncbi:hypothetical protein GMRT_10181 [Giardia muris]|uniref:Uncharacterized protein n=1 Tax=Giardia muris TaxID=5742 RepID=A0A4Z1T2V5_GIAMU|nr:hypothetical protein GMRT_10181 [Giardia muris]|eukprot:TNJ26751.1 hypothetical protein GMRT_10181 [Giardia muris]